MPCELQQHTGAVLQVTAAQAIAQGISEEEAFCSAEERKRT